MRNWQECVIFFAPMLCFLWHSWLSSLLSYMAFWVFSLGLKKPVEFSNSYTLLWHPTLLPLWREDAAEAGQSSCYGSCCTASCGFSSLKSTSEVFSCLLLSFCRGGWWWVLQGQGGSGPAAPVPEPGLMWSDEDLKSSSSAPTLELIAGP